MQQKSSRSLGYMALIAIVIGLFGCEYLRVVTYPPEFTYLTNDDVESAMGRMAAHVSRLDELLNQEATDDSAQKTAVVAEIKDLEGIARSLGAGQSPTNHLYIDANVDGFATYLRRARLRVEQDPPDYYLIGQITGNCSACHVRR